MRGYDPWRKRTRETGLIFRGFAFKALMNSKAAQDQRVRNQEELLAVTWSWEKNWSLGLTKKKLLNLSGPQSGPLRARHLEWEWTKRENLIKTSTQPKGNSVPNWVVIGPHYSCLPGNRLNSLWRENILSRVSTIFHAKFVIDDQKYPGIPRNRSKEKQILEVDPQVI